MQKERESWFICVQDLPEVFERLSEPLPMEALQKASKKDTRLPYDMTGYNCYYGVERMNKVLNGHWRVVEEESPPHDTSKEVCCRLRVEIGNWRWDEKEGIFFEVLASSPSVVGGVRRYGFVFDNLKGAQTNALKRALAYFGVGIEAYKGTLDDDYAEFIKSAESQPEEKPTIASTLAKVETVRRVQKDLVSLRKDTGKLIWDYISREYEKLPDMLDWWRKNSVDDRVRKHIASVLTEEMGVVVNPFNLDGLTKILDFLLNRESEIPAVLYAVGIIGDDGKLIGDVG